MAKIIDLTDSYFEWLASLPLAVQELCRRCPPDRLYRMKNTGQRVTVVSYSENGTLTVNVSGMFNAVIFERNVFGVDPASLEECDLPAEDEVVGVLLTGVEDIESFVDSLRAEEERNGRMGTD